MIDRRLYLPEHSWCTDPERRQAAGIPDEVQFATKPRLAWEMIAAALDAGVEAPWVTGDEAYGQDPQLRAALEARGTGYVLAVACSIRVRINSGRTPIRADTVADRLPEAAWHRPLAELVRVAGSRWSIECFQAAKGQVGLEHYQVRNWTSWHRHVTLAMLALAFLATVAADAAPDRPAEPRHHLRGCDPISLTVPEIRHLFTAVLNPPGVSLARLLHWSSWRRRHQATARRSHYRRRSAHETSG